MTMMILLILENFFLPSKIIMGKHYIRMSYSSLFIPSLCYNFSFHSELRGFLIKKRELDWNGTTPEERMKRRGSKEAGNREWGEYGITERRTSRKLPWNNGNSRKVERCWFASIEMRLFSREGKSIELLVYYYEILTISPTIETVITRNLKNTTINANKKILPQ